LALYPDRVHVVGRQRWRNEFDANVLLRGLEPEIATIRWHGPGMWRALGGLISSALVLGYYRWQFGNSIPSVLIAICAIAAAASIAAFIACYPMYKGYRFMNLSGIVVLDMIEAGPDKDLCEDFAMQVSDAIRAARSTDPAKEKG
jgi:hypothetical protein